MVNFIFFENEVTFLKDIAQRISFVGDTNEAIFHFKSPNVQ